MNEMAWIVITSFLLVEKFITSYSSKKGENLATKEDIENITEKIESVKTKILEISHISKYRYEKEYTILVQISEKIFILRNSFDKLLLNYENSPRNTQEMKNFQNATIDLFSFCNCMKPFFANDIYEKIVEFDTLCWNGSGSHIVLVNALNCNSNEVFQQQMSKMNDIKKEINLSIDTLYTAIRKRIESWEINT